MMSEKYRNKYRIKSARLQNWDYGWNGAYFITICTKNRRHYFGKIINSKMQLSEIGIMAEKYWHEIPKHFPFVKLDSFVVMPNHIHGIIKIDKINDGRDDTTATDTATDTDTDTVETQNFASLPQPQPQPQPQPPPQSQSPPQPPPQSQSPPQPQPPPQPQKNKFGPQSKNLASIIRGYKIGVTKNAKQINPLWQWQSRFHDHIIRNETEYQRIKNYITNNPQNWNNDKFKNPNSGK